MNPYNLRLLRRWGSSLRATCALLSLVMVAIDVQPATGTAIPLSDSNTNITIDTGGGGGGIEDGADGGVVQWEIDGVPQLFQEWYWLRIDEEGGSAETPIDAFDLDFENTDDLDNDLIDDILYARYVDLTTGIEIEVQYMVAGSQQGSGSSSLSEQLAITNGGNSTQTLHLFMYSDFNLSNTAGDDSANVVGAGNNTVRQYDALSKVETVTTPLPSHVQTSPASVILDSLNDGAPTTLDDSKSLAAADVTWALQWDFTLGAGDVFILSAQKNFFIVPEPSTLTLIGLGFIGLLAVVCRHPRRRH